MTPPVADFFVLNRLLRVADGPDEVHLSQVGKLKIEELSKLHMNGRYMSAALQSATEEVGVKCVI